MNRFWRLESLYDHLNDPLYYPLIVQYWLARILLLCYLTGLLVRRTSDALSYEMHAASDVFASGLVKSQKI